MLGKWVGEQAAGARTAVAKKTQLALVGQAEEPEASPAENDRELPPVPSPPPELEERVRRLEDILAGMQHSPSGIQETPPQLPPEAPAPELPPVPPDAVPLPSPASPPWLSPGLFPSHRWLPFEMLAEFRAMIRMYLDPRYRLTWQTRLLPPVILFGMFLSWWLFTSIAVIGFLLDRAIFLVLAYALFKVLTREATRYRMTSPDIPPSMRL
jgi:hypothetical protein